MRIISCHNLQRLRQHLRLGGAIAYPTESCYGLGCLPTDYRAVRRIINIKKRPQHKGLIVIGQNLAQLQPLLQTLPQSTQNHLNSVWAAPKTFVLPAQNHLPHLLRGKGRNKLAVRVPDHALARHLCAVLNTPLVSTSCNRAKQRPCKTAREVQRQFGRQVLIVRGRIGNRKKPSDIIDWQTETQLR
ncbi:L-threonylcarbamoyladenylate synthase [Alysiella filiformis]|uniref:Threonylcarbamoyl-AMP synthase n=1 Tax=Alysiella filiformis DSM 16848 TaxID=1120981 RepID=A0A286ECN9_9NEIS|nr:L-threonylcarbamoyladenylate synthase [Alysiella filiformis]QMT31885.1 L-threonylcarbamoyladenylate synthase [Alysiella filiformis]UBQ57209.1 L-threonylcarbamoyladenylate synthase [Alysiella filiformis DSM 16848]SOD68682.1 translation factor SUA5 [Alysiella filiformis DSM 16848]